VSDIYLVQAHLLNPKKARAAAEKVALEMAQQFGMTSDWQGDTLKFQRSGVSGTLTLLPNEAQLDITLGVLLRAFKAKIEQRISGNMYNVFCSDTQVLAR
jgi:putative polyhydroxyalkanoate system protein